MVSSSDAVELQVNRPLTFIGGRVWGVPAEESGVERGYVRGAPQSFCWPPR